EVKNDPHAGGMVSTALRATDIVMDRVWQLEIDAFHGARGFVFAPVTEVVEPADDPTALHPEVQRQVARVRTDLDRVSTVEISSLVQHGYCVGRYACRTRPDVFGTELPGGAPWDPFPHPRGAAPVAPADTRSPAPSALDRRIRAEPTPIAKDARTLQG